MAGIYDCHIHFDYDSYLVDNDMSQWNKTLLSHGIGHVFLMGLKALIDPAFAAEENRAIAKFASKSECDVIPFGIVNTGDKDKAVAEAVRCLDEYGFAGIKIHPWLQGCSVFSPPVIAVCQAVAERGKILLFHDGTPAYAMPSQIGGLALEFPNARFLLSHAGLVHLWKSALSWAETAANVWLGLCGPPAYGCAEICRRLNGEKIVWGSDLGFPDIDPIPYRMGALTEAGIDQRILNKVFYENPQVLLGH